MAANWYCFTDDESGPHSFQELAQKVATGELQESDMVRREDAPEWQRVDSVVGLMRAATKAPRATETATTRRGQIDYSAAFEEPPPSSKRQLWKERLLSRNALICVLSLTMMVIFGLEIRAAIWGGPEQFPPGLSAGIRSTEPARLEQMRARPPAIASLPGLTVNRPAEVPGFEEVPWLKSPTLTRDLRTIVYVSSGGGSGNDLYIASRKSTRDPFTNHRPIAATASPQSEVFPSLSADGKLLAYAQEGGRSRLMFTRRGEDGEFIEPVPIEILDDPYPEEHHDAPQLLTPTILVYTTYDANYKHREQILAERKGNEGEFQYLKPVPIANPWPRYFLTALGQRIYFADEGGVSLAAIHQVMKEYVSPERLLTTDVVGPELTQAGDTIWVHPAEDLLFYCSPGPANAESDEDDAAEDEEDSPMPPERRLWVVRF